MYGVGPRREIREQELWTIDYTRRDTEIQLLDGRGGRKRMNDGGIQEGHTQWCRESEVWGLYGMRGYGWGGVESKT